MGKRGVGTDYVPGEVEDGRSYESRAKGTVPSQVRAGKGSNRMQVRQPGKMKCKSCGAMHTEAGCPMCDESY